MPESSSQQTNEAHKPGSLDEGSAAPRVGENACPLCHGTTMVDGKPCQNCGGTGVVEPDGKGRLTD